MDDESKRYEVMPAYYEVQGETGTGYVPHSECLTNPDMHRLVRDMAVRRLEEWCDRYEGYFHHTGDTQLAGIFRAIGAAREEMGAEWPTFYETMFEYRGEPPLG